LDKILHFLYVKLLFNLLLYQNLFKTQPKTRLGAEFSVCNVSEFQSKDKTSRIIISAQLPLE